MPARCWPRRSRRTTRRPWRRRSSTPPGSASSARPASASAANCSGARTGSTRRSTGRSSRKRGARERGGGKPDEGLTQSVVPGRAISGSDDQVDQQLTRRTSWLPWSCPSNGSWLYGALIRIRFAESDFGNRIAAEALSIVLWAHALKPHKTSPQRLFRAEPAARRDSLGGQAGLGEQLTSRLDAQPLDRARGRQPHRRAIAAQEG